MTEASLLPEAAAVAGISYADLCRQIIELSLRSEEARRSEDCTKIIRGRATSASPIRANAASSICST